MSPPLRLLALVALAAFASGPVDAKPAKRSIVGAWRLVTYVDTPEGGEPVYAFGREPIGMFVFTADGHVSVSIMRNPPKADAASGDPDPDACVPEWYCSYFGSYRVDWNTGAWTIRVSGGNIPSFIGTEQTRAFTLKGDRIFIVDSYSDGKRQIKAERVLERLNAGSSQH